MSASGTKTLMRMKGSLPFRHASGKICGGGGGASGTGATAIPAEGAEVFLSSRAGAGERARVFLCFFLEDFGSKTAAHNTKLGTTTL